MSWFRVGSVAVGLIAVVSLGGCAVASAVATKTFPPPTASSQPTPAPAPIVAPSSRIPLDCTALVDPAAITAVESTLSLSPSQPVSPPYTREVMREQAGNLNCDWMTPDQRTDSASITVSADGATGYKKTVFDGKPSLGVGEDSWGYCETNGNFCHASVLDGDYWFTIEIGQITNAQETPTDVLRGLATSVASRLAAAGAPSPAWQAPVTAWSPVVSCTDLGTAVPMADVMAPGPATSTNEWNSPGDENDINRWATRESVFYNCAWQWKAAPVNQDMLIVQIVPGGEWVWPQLEASPGVTSTPLDVPVATAAAYRCDNSSRCWADAIIDHGWVQITGTSNNIPDVQNKLAKALTALAGYAASK